MKKIGIMTFPHSPSFGASLQMTALYAVVEKLGYEAYIVNYMNDYMKNEKHISSAKVSYLRKLLRKIGALKSKKAFKTFESTLNYIPKKKISTYEDLRKIDGELDSIVCGSDQVWNMNITGYDMGYFLNFCEKSRRVSYAPSFGITELEEKVKESVRGELLKFSSISVREKSGIPIVQELIEKKPALVIDPTMLMPVSFWHKKKKKAHGLPKSYIAVFTFRANQDTYDFINDLERRTGLPTVKYNWGIKSFIQKNSASNLGPAEWLDFINRAEYVVTDSFHGTVFSILFNKNLFVSMTSIANTRLINLLEEFELSDRVISDSTNRNPIDYKKVNEILELKSKESLEYLKEALM